MNAALLDTTQAAAYMGTTPRHIRELWVRRELAAVRVGRLIRFAVVDLDAYIARQRVEAVR